MTGASGNDEPTAAWTREAETVCRTPLERQAYVQGRRAGWVAQEQAQDVARRVVTLNRSLMKELREGRRDRQHDGVPCVMLWADGRLEVEHLTSELSTRQVLYLERPVSPLRLPNEEVLGRLLPEYWQHSFRRHYLQGLSKAVILFEEIGS